MLPEDVLAHILWLAFRPAAWPWRPEPQLVCRAWRGLCLKCQTRYWFLRHSTMGLNG